MGAKAAKREPMFGSDPRRGSIWESEIERLHARAESDAPSLDTDHDSLTRPSLRIW